MIHFLHNQILLSIYNLYNMRIHILDMMGFVILYSLPLLLNQLLHSLFLLCIHQIVNMHLLLYFFLLLPKSLILVLFRLMIPLMFLNRMFYNYYLV